MRPGRRAPARPPNRGRPRTGRSRWPGPRGCRRWVRRPAARSRRPTPAQPPPSAAGPWPRWQRWRRGRAHRSAPPRPTFSDHEGEEGGRAAGDDRAGPLVAHRFGQRARRDGFGREVELDTVAVEGGAQRAAAGVEGQRCAPVDRAALAQGVGRGQGGVPAQVDLGGGREPAQAEGGPVVGRRQEGRLGDARARRRWTACAPRREAPRAGRRRRDCRRRARR